MSSERPIKCIDSRNGERYVEFMARDDGYSRFIEWGEDEDLGYKLWIPAHFSGIYADQELAERDACAALPWLRDQISD